MTSLIHNIYDAAYSVKDFKFLRLFLTFSTALANLRDLLNFLERIRAALYRVRNITLKAPTDF